jgi:hypothetical protein
VKIKIIPKILNKKSIPKCEDKWNNVYNEEFHWSTIWNNLKRLDISNKIKEFQWKCKIALFTPKVDHHIFSHLS